MKICPGFKKFSWFRQISFRCHLCAAILPDYYANHTK